MSFNIKVFSALFALTACSTLAQGIPSVMGENEIPRLIRQMTNMQVCATSEVRWLRTDEKTLHYELTNRFEGGVLKLLAAFPKTPEGRPAHACLRIIFSPKKIWDFQLNLGSDYCQKLAGSLVCGVPSDARGWDARVAGPRVAKLKELLCGQYSYKSPPY